MLNEIENIISSKTRSSSLFKRNESSNVEKMNKQPYSFNFKQEPLKTSTSIGHIYLTAHEQKQNKSREKYEKHATAMTTIQWNEQWALNTRVNQQNIKNKSDWVTNEVQLKQKWCTTKLFCNFPVKTAVHEWIHCHFWSTSGPFNLWHFISKV